MSLINQVLKDLEQRQVAEAGDGATILQHVRYVPAATGRHRHWRMISWIGTTVLILAGLTGVYFWRNYKVILPVQIAHESNPVPVSALPLASQNMPVSQQTPVPPVITIVNSTPIIAVEQATEPVPAKLHSKTIKSPVETPAKTAEIEQGNESAVVYKQPIVRNAAEQAAITYQQAYDLIAQQHWREAEMKLREALQLDATQYRLRELLVGVYIKTGRWVEADTILAQGLNLTPVHQPLVKLRARTLMQLNQDRQAIAVLAQFAPSLSADPDHFALLAVLQQRVGQHDQAVNLYEQLLAKNPNIGVWWVGKGISLEALHRQGEARRAFEHARASGNLSLEVSRYTDNRLRVLQATGLSTIE